MSRADAAGVAVATIFLAAGCVGRDAIARTQDPLTSVRDGFWLAWWPGSTQARRVVAVDGAGTEIGSVVAR